MKPKILSIACLALCAFSLAAHAAPPPNDPPAKSERFDSPRDFALALSDIPAPYVLTLKAPALVPDLLAAFKLAVPAQRVTLESPSSLEYRHTLYTPGDVPLPCALLDVLPSMAESDTGKLQLASYRSGTFSTLDRLTLKRIPIQNASGGGISFRQSPLRLL